MMKHTRLFLITALAGLTLTACNDFLDELPDDRIEIDKVEKVEALLASAYPADSYVRLAELASDNVDDLNGDLNGNYDRFSEQCYRWQEITESDNENAAMVWQGHYAAIASANHALQAIDELGGASASDELRALRGEALLCRAYSHFILTNLFCLNYSKAYSESDLGIPYITEPESTLHPHYERPSVAEDYRLIEKDLLEGLQLMSDVIYTNPRYHFNSKAAYTFASRFYLFYQQPEKVIEYSTKALGDNPSALMRDYDAMQSMPTDNMQPRAMQYVSVNDQANFLLLPVISNDAFYFQGYSTGGRFNTNHYIGQAELFFATPWAPETQAAAESQSIFRFYWFYSQDYDKFLLPKTPYFFEEINPNNHTGYYRTVVVALKAEEAVLNRAEAYAVLGQNDKALADINIWTNSFIVDSVTYVSGGHYNWDPFEYVVEYSTEKVPRDLTMESIHKWHHKYDYYTPERPLPRKHLNPEWLQLTEGSDQECLLQTILLLRRLEFLHEGMRWFDIKRYGMKIYRREINAALNMLTLTDSMEYRDPRQAIQLPFEVRGAGLQPNPRPVETSPELVKWPAGSEMIEFKKR
ncbi:MAG: RagB/SusD family nutrient uptake outer membrane protein [Prevotella sp.]|nr:RagB/SusD family nutrient uptake outer membrane protein [Prevotella sp.]